MLHRITGRITAVLVGVVLGATLTVAGQSTARPTDDTPTIGVAAQHDIWWTWTFNRLPDCRTEDSRNCRWAAHRTHNGKGHAFVDLDGRTYYRERGYALDRQRRVSAPRCDGYGQWRQVPQRLVGDRVDGVAGGSFRVTPRSCWHPGATTYVINPRGRVGIS